MRRPSLLAGAGLYGLDEGAQSARRCGRVGGTQEGGAEGAAGLGWSERRREEEAQVGVRLRPLAVLEQGREQGGTYRVAVYERGAEW